MEIEIYQDICMFAAQARCLDAHQSMRRVKIQGRRERVKRTPDDG